MKVKHRNAYVGGFYRAISCQEPLCRERWYTKVSVQVRKNGKVFFKVQCEACGTTHFLPRTDLEKAVEEYLKQVAAGE